MVLSVVPTGLGSTLFAVPGFPLHSVPGPPWAILLRSLRELSVGCGGSLLSLGAERQLRVSPLRLRVAKASVEMTVSLVEPRAMVLRSDS